MNTLECVAPQHFCVIVAPTQKSERPASFGCRAFVLRSNFQREGSALKDPLEFFEGCLAFSDEPQPVLVKCEATFRPCDRLDLIA